jgi:peptidyl-prolyl cis-trans isomerase SurA
MTKLLYGTLLALLVAAPLGAEILEQIVVKVNGEILTKTELESRQVAALRARNRSVSAADLENDEELKKALQEITPQLVVDAVDEMLIMQQGKERGYRLTDDRFKEIVERIRKDNKLEDEEAFQAALKQEGLTLGDLRRNMERQMVVSQVQRDAVGRVSVSDEEAHAYYDAHQQEFTSPASLTLREMLVEVPTSKNARGEPVLNVAADEDAKARAEALRARIVGGEDFAALAGTESAAASRANGGLVGPVSREELAPALQTIVDTLKVGEVSPVVRTARGYQFFELETLSPSTVLPFDKARDQIVDKVYAEKRNAEFQKYMKKLREQAIIEWKNEEIRKAYEKANASRTD